MRIKYPAKTLMAAGCFALLSIPWVLLLSTQASSKAEDAVKRPAGADEPAPPSDQTFIGTKQCASCHFDQFVIWKKDKHTKAFEDLPTKYRTNADCLKCHTTGYGEPTGYKSAADTHLAAISCEQCHGPGSKHAQIAKPFANVAKLSPEQSTKLRDSIWLMKPENICVTCHSSKAHKAHPKYDK